MFAALTTIGLLAVAANNIASRAEDLPVPPRGTDDLARVPFRVTNAGAAPVACMIATAHWYSVDLGTAAKGLSIRRDLWASTVSGEIFVLNAKQDRMPVQSLWCGIAGRTWTTRSVVALEGRAGERPNPIDLTCRSEGERLQCRPSDETP